MFVVLLRFAGNKASAPQFMPAHNEWVKRGLDDGVFLLVGSLKPNQGGAILAANITEAELQTRLGDDPFVAEGVVATEVLEIAPGKADPRLAFLLA